MADHCEENRKIEDAHGEFDYRAYSYISKLFAIEVKDDNRYIENPEDPDDE